MAGVKMVVIYPRPADEAAFEQAYKEEHIPMMESKLKGMTRLVLSKVRESPQGKVMAYKLVEVHFQSIEELNRCAESEGGQEVIAHAQKMSTGGPPILLICDEESFVYW
jgi:uncharacterized protein (TIGR02118 family)